MLMDILEWPDASGQDDHGRGEMVKIAKSHGYNMRKERPSVLFDRNAKENDVVGGSHPSGATLAIQRDGTYVHTAGPNSAVGKQGSGPKSLASHLTKFHGK